MATHPSTSSAAEVESRWGGPRTILGLILVGAAVLRLVGIQYGLPYGNVLDPDEQSIVPRAWAMTHGAGADPHPFFDYPSLLLYVLAPFQAWHDAPSYLSARVVVAVLGVAGVGAAWMLGRHAYGRGAAVAAAATTAVATVHVAYSHMAVTDVPLTPALTGAVALALTGRLVRAGIPAGGGARRK